MKITAITAQAKNANRVNVMVDGKYRFSLDIFQVSDLGIKVGKVYSEEELVALEEESQFGKLYARALEYVMMRPHSAKEVKDYLWRKTLTTKVRIKETNQYKERKGVSQATADRVYFRLEEKGYINDDAFAKYWFDNRSELKGASVRKLANELSAKGVSREIIDRNKTLSGRSDSQEILKLLNKKASKYSDERKLIAYLQRQGFSYDDIRNALNSIEN